MSPLSVLKTMDELSAETAGYIAIIEGALSVLCFCPSTDATSMVEDSIRSPLSLSFIPTIHSLPNHTGAFRLAIRIGLEPSILGMNVPVPATLYSIFFPSGDMEGQR